MDWIHELSEAEIAANLDKDVALVNQECGLDVLIKLWDKLAGINIYISERSLYNLKRLYVRKCKALDPALDIKRLAVRLQCSEKFIQESLAVTDAEDPRQEKLL